MALVVLSAAYRRIRADIFEYHGLAGCCDAADDTLPEFEGTYPVIYFGSTSNEARNSNSSVSSLKRNTRVLSKLNISVILAMTASAMSFGAKDWFTAVVTS